MFFFTVWFWYHYVVISQLSVGRMQTVILTVKIPSIQSSRKVKVCLDETVGELIRWALLQYTLPPISLHLSPIPHLSLSLLRVLSSEFSGANYLSFPPSIHNTSTTSSQYIHVLTFDPYSTLMRRVPDPESPRWAHMSLYLSTKDERGGAWMEDFKFLAAYKLKNTVS